MRRNPPCAPGIVICALLVSQSALGAPVSEGLAVETGSPDALCPDLASTRDAIHNRLGTLSLGGEQGGWVARYTVGHAPGEAGDFVRLELLDPSGTERLLRDLPRQGESCATLAQAIALVVERYFRELEPEATEHRASDSPAPPALTSAPAAAAAPQASAPPPAPSAPDRLTPRWALGASFGLASAEPGAVAGAQAGYWLRPEVHLELALLADLAAHRQTLGGVELELRSYPVELALGIGRRGRAWDFFAGPEVRWSLETTGGSDLRALDSSPGAAFAAGVAGGVSWWPRSALGLSARASLDYRLGGTRFRVATPNGLEEVLKLPSLQGLFLVGLIFGSRS